MAELTFCGRSDVCDGSRHHFLPTPDVRLSCWETSSVWGKRLAWVDVKSLPRTDTLCVATDQRVSYQPQLFPRKALIEYPKSKPTADALGEVDADDGHRYFIKDDNIKPTRASEWIGTRVADAVGISTPMPALIERLNGRVVFGSRRVAGIAEDVITRAFLLSPSNTGQNGIPNLRSIISSIYVFDLFMFNDDRHYGNYITYDDQGIRRTLAFDFSRAVFWRWPWQGVPEAIQHTRTHGSNLRRLHGFDKAVASSTLGRLQALHPDAVESFIKEMPPDWLSAKLRADFLAWWDGPGRAARVKEIEKGLDDGTLL